MRNTLIRPLSIVLVLILTAFLTPVGTNVSEATGGTAGLWHVAIPTDLNGLNLAGSSPVPDDGYAVFEDQGFRGSVRVNLSKTKVGGVLNYAFTLLFAPGTTGYGVVIDGMELTQVWKDPRETPCSFANRVGCTATEPPGCMECFFEGPHPYAMYDFSLQVATDEDVENQAVAGGRLFLDMWDYNDPTGAYHRLSCSSDRKRVSIERSGDVWTITNGANTYLTCEEYYLVTQGRAKSVKHTVMTATTAVPFVFKTIWTGE